MYRILSHRSPCRSRAFALWLTASLALLLLTSTESHAGPWSKGLGQFYVKLGQGFIFNSDATTPGANANPFFSTTTSIYAETGLGYGLQVHGYLPYTFATLTSQNNPKEFYRLNAFADGIFGVQWSPPMLQKRLGFPMALKLNVKVPLYNTKVAASADDTDGIPPLPVAGKFPYIGDGQLDFTLWYSIGGSIPKTPLYAFAELGYRFRTKSFIDNRIGSLGVGFSDTIVLAGQLGYNFWRRFIAMFNVNFALPLSGFPPSETEWGKLTGVAHDGSQDDFYSKGFLALGIGLYLPVWKGLAIEANFDAIVLAIRSDRGFNMGVGVSYSY